MKGFIEFKESKGGAKAGKLELIKINLDKAKDMLNNVFTGVNTSNMCTSVVWSPAANVAPPKF